MCTIASKINSVTHTPQILYASFSLSFNFIFKHLITPNVMKQMIISLVMTLRSLHPDSPIFSLFSHFTLTSLLFRPRLPHEIQEQRFKRIDHSTWLALYFVVSFHSLQERSVQIDIIPEKSSGRHEQHLAFMSNTFKYLSFLNLLCTNSVKFASLVAKSERVANWNVDQFIVEYECIEHYHTSTL